MAAPARADVAADPPVEGRATPRLWHSGSRLLWPAGVRCAAAIVFLIFGMNKFVNHAAELASFRHYPLPAPDTLVYAVGVIEICGGLLLLAGLLTRLTALALAADMLGAIVVSGLARWETVSLTLAPVLLAAMIILIRFGAGDWSLDRRLAANVGRRAAFLLILARHPSSNPGHSGDSIGRDGPGRSGGLSRRSKWRRGHCA
jgi:putative oxidoreductase